MDKELVNMNIQSLLEEIGGSINNIVQTIGDYLESPFNENKDAHITQLTKVLTAVSLMTGSVSGNFNQLIVFITGNVGNEERKAGFQLMEEAISKKKNK